MGCQELEDVVSMIETNQYKTRCILYLYLSCFNWLRVQIWFFFWKVLSQNLLRLFDRGYLCKSCYLSFKDNSFGFSKGLQIFLNYNSIHFCNICLYTTFTIYVWMFIWHGFKNMNLYLQKVLESQYFRMYVFFISKALF